MGNFPVVSEQTITKPIDNLKDVIINGENAAQNVVITGEKVVADGFTDVLSTAQFGILTLGIIVLYSVMKIDLDKATDVVVVPFKTVREVAKKIP